MKIIKSILQTDLFQLQPPVLVDVGASKEINPKWKLIAPYSICIAFDADDREFHISEETNKAYKKLFTFNRIVIDEAVEKADFYLTNSPFCSSLLEPDTKNLGHWIFSSLFTVNKKTQLSAITVEQALLKINIDYIDWFKTDTQGTDLRLFKTLPQNIAGQVLAAEFEPGILDAYLGEDKLYSVMEYLQRHNFWLSSMQPKGVQRLNASYVNKLGSFASGKIIKKSPGWAEVTYLRQAIFTNKRQLLLLYIFALLEKQYGFALEIVDFALQHIGDSIFEDCKKEVLKKLKTERWKIPFVIFKRRFNKFFGNIND